MSIKIYQIDAFTNKLFGGNPAAVCPLDKWLDDALMQKIAMENNLSETAFFVKSGDKYQIRWFAPKVEVKLCGHGTLATAYVIFNYVDKNANQIIFESKSGDLIVVKEQNNITLDFPTAELTQCASYDDKLIRSLKVKPKEVLLGRGTDYVVVLESQSDVEHCKPDFKLLEEADARGVAITAIGDEVDFVSRWFAPKGGVNEDPVAGSAHCMLTPYWNKKLNKTKLHAKQLSARGGDLSCELHNNRVLLTGQALPYIIGEIYL